MFGILVDITKCTGCERCVDACVEANKLDAKQAQIDSVRSPDGLSSQRLTSILRLRENHFARKSCMHCLEPSCVSACLVGGLTKTEEGPVIYDSSKCIGCRYCMLACPFHIPRYEWDSIHPYMVKCMMCFDRLRDGGIPACVEACPNQVLTFSDRDKLLKEAHDRIARYPGRYKNHVWGEEEFGGTSVLYISDIDLDQMDWPQDSVPSIPELTGPLIAKTPFIGLSVAGSLLGINWVIRRRMKLEIVNKVTQENSEADTGKGQDNG
jgi:formate dehydrogenase iron-sulfur subunit